MLKNIRYICFLVLLLGVFITSSCDVIKNVIDPPLPPVIKNGEPLMDMSWLPTQTAEQIEEEGTVVWYLPTSKCDPEFLITTINPPEGYDIGNYSCAEKWSSFLVTTGRTPYNNYNVVKVRYSDERFYLYSVSDNSIIECDKDQIEAQDFVCHLPDIILQFKVEPSPTQLPNQ